MQIEAERCGNVVVLVPRGEVDATALAGFEARVDGLLEEGQRLLLWDLSEVPLLPSTAIGFLLTARRRVHSVGGRMALANASRIVHATLQTFGVLDVCPAYEDRGAAVRDLEAVGVAPGTPPPSAEPA